jgi:hypothetical protein
VGGRGIDRWPALCDRSWRLGEGFRCQIFSQTASSPGRGALPLHVRSTGLREDGRVNEGIIVIWLRISGLALLIVGVLLLLLIPMWGRYVALGSVALIIAGAASLAAGTRRRHSRDSTSGGVYGDVSGGWSRLDQSPGWVTRLSHRRRRPRCRRASKTASAVSLSFKASPMSASSSVPVALGRVDASVDPRPAPRVLDSDGGRGVNATDSSRPVGIGTMGLGRR